MNTIREFFATLTIAFTTIQRFILAIDHGAEALEVTAAVALADVKLDNKDKLSAYRALVLEEQADAAKLAKAKAKA